MKNKKSEELLYLKEFFELYEISPEKINSDNEAPDFIIDYSGKKIGIEFTEYHSLLNIEGHSRREIESNWEKLRDEIYEKVKLDNKLLGISVSIFFRKVLMPSQKEKECFINELITLSKLGLLKDKDVITIPDKFKTLKKYVDKIRISKINIDSYLKWNSNINVGFIGLSEDALIGVIAPKINKEDRYLSRNLDELWLIVVFGHRISQSVFPRLKNKLDGFRNLNLILNQASYKYIFLYLHMYDVIYRWPDWGKFGSGKFFNLNE